MQTDDSLVANKIVSRGTQTELKLCGFSAVQRESKTFTFYNSIDQLVCSSTATTCLLCGAKVVICVNYPYLFELQIKNF
jgi:hypothetical protein